MGHLGRFLGTVAMAGCLTACGTTTGFQPSLNHVPNTGRDSVANAVFKRLAGPAGRLTAESAGLPPEAFALLDANHDGQVDALEWNRPGANVTREQLEQASRGLANAAFEVGAAGKASVPGQTLKEAWQLADGDTGNLDRAAGAKALGAVNQWDRSRFVARYPDLHADSWQLRGLGALLTEAYLKIVGSQGARFMCEQPRNHAHKDPAAFGLAAEQAWITTSDGVQLNTWYLPAATESHKCVILIHGHGSNRSTWIGSPELTALHGAGYNVVAFDLRAHGESGGKYITFALHEDNDLIAETRFAQQKGNTAIGFKGDSLGGASAIHAAAELPEIQAVWEDSAFASFQLAVTSAAANLHAPFLRLTIAAVTEAATRLVGEDMSAADPDVWVQKLSPRPIYIVHGGADDYIFPENSRINFAAARDPRELWIVPGATHCDSATTAPAEYTRRLLAFFDANLKP